MWCVPTIDDEFRQRMFDVLRVYQKPWSPLFPLVCVDEKSVELHDDKHPAIRRRGIVLRDHEYIRRGTANIFVATEPKGGRHFGQVTKRRTKRDFAQFLKWLASLYPHATKIHLVMDNLNTHRERALIERYGDDEGRRLWARFHVHYTPKHASWLNQAEIAIAVMTRACLHKNRISSIDELRKNIKAFWKSRRKHSWKIDWRFTVRDSKRWLKEFETQH